MINHETERYDPVEVGTLCCVDDRIGPPAPPSSEKADGTSSASASPRGREHDEGDTRNDNGVPCELRDRISL